MFRRLQTRLTVLYAALFGAVLAAVAVAVLWGVTDQAQRQGRAGLSAAGDVFDRLWDLRAERLQVGAGLLSRDYGFRQALATRDAATVDSAVANLRLRLGLDLAFVVDAQGVPLAPPADADVAAAVRALGPALADGGEVRGVAVIRAQAYEVVSAPILAPEPQGWVVFAMRLNASQMQSLSRLSPVPLTAAVVRRGPDGWLDLEDGGRRIAPLGVLGRAGLVASPQGATLALARPLQAAQDGVSPALLLRYPLRAALAPFQRLLWLIGAVGLFGLALVVAGSWALARSVTRPISVLSAAARRLQSDGSARAAVEAGDEVGELARTFNAMADAVADREQRLRQAALTDAETGLPNRPALEAAAIGMRAAGRVAVVALGVERFARMRGSLGYDLSSDLFGELGRRLAEARPDWTIARTSADILGAAFPAADIAEARRLAEAAAVVLQAPHAVGDQMIDVRIVAGLSAGDDPGQLVREADLALDAARAGGLRLAVFDRAGRARAAESLELMPALRRALADDALSLVHQPKYDPRRGEVAGVESLVRWLHPRRGPLAPDVFIGLAEETGDIRALTEWVAGRAIAEQAELAAAGLVLPFSINLSGRLVGDPEMTRRLIGLAGRAKGPICLEITETAAMGRPEATLASFQQFREAGVAVSIDDYGSGLSSLAYLKRIAASELKLDRSLVCDVARSSRDALLVKSTVDLAHGLGMKVVAEGVEDQTTMALLAGMGCDLIQGWAVARPMPLADLRAFLRRPLTAAHG